MIVIDTSVVLAFMDRRHDSHERVREWMERVVEELCTTPLVLAELDHLVTRQGGAQAATALREDFEDGAYRAARPLVGDANSFTLLPADAP